MKSFKTKLVKTAAIMGTCLAIMSSVAMANFVQVQNGTWGTVRYNDSTKTFVSASEDVKIRIRQNAIMDPDIIITAWKNGDKLFEEHFFNAIAWKVDEVVDEDNGRVFYVIKSNRKDARQLVMGYDKVLLKWRIYLDSSNYYNGVNGSPNFFVKDGNFYLEYSDKFGTKHTYQFTWDSSNRGFASEDLG